MRSGRSALVTGLSGLARIRQAIRGRWMLRDCDVVGSWSRVMSGRPIVDNRGYIELGSRTRFMCEFGPIELRTAPGGRLEIGARTGINYGTSFQVVHRSPSARTSTGRPSSRCDTGVSSSPTGYGSSMVIPDSVWLAAASQCCGSKIGSGAIITAGSVVDGEIRPTSSLVVFGEASEH
jgi:acetyltransferase-like isoleucine patch superfamily enzyme